MSRWDAYHAKDQQRSSLTPRQTICIELTSELHAIGEQNLQVEDSKMTLSAVAGSIKMASNQDYRVTQIGA